MANIFISLNDGDDAPRVETLTIERTGERFMSVRFGDACTVTLPGYNHVTADHAFALAAAIQKAAAELKVSLLQTEAEPVEAAS